MQYVADSTHGFRVAATNLPVEAPDVAQARDAHLAEFEAIKAERAKVVPYFNPVSVSLGDVPQVLPIQLFLPTRSNYSIFQLPQPVTDLPEVVKARAEHLAVLNAAYRNAQAAQLGYGLPQPVVDLPEVILMVYKVPKCNFSLTTGSESTQRTSRCSSKGNVTTSTVTLTGGAKPSYKRHKWSRGAGTNPP